MNFSRPEVVPLFGALFLYIDPATYAGDAAVLDAVDRVVENYGVGNDWIAAQINGAVIMVAGVVDFQLPTVIDDEEPPGAEGNFIIGPRQIGVRDFWSVTTTPAVTD